MIKELLPAQLKDVFDSKKLNCKTTEELKPLEGIIGQDRAVKALKFGLNIPDGGFNIFVSGYTGTGRTTSVKSFVQELARSKPAPSDWCYVNNFQNAYEPNAIKLPAGKGKIFYEDIKNFIINIRSLLPKTFESKDYSEKRDTLVKAIEDQKEKILIELNKKAEQLGLVLKSSQIGIFMVPVVEGKIINEQEFLNLSVEKRQEIQKNREKINEDLKKSMDQVRDFDKQIEDELKKLNHDVALFTIEKQLNDLKEKYRDFNEIVKYIDEIKEDILKNIALFLTGGTVDPSAQALFPWMKELPFKKYEVNLVIDNSTAQGAPVVIEQNPTYPNLFGRIEKDAQFGVLTTDFTMIRAGSLHKANEGFLVIPIEELLKNFLSWDSLKNALVDKKITIEEVGEKLGYISTKGIKPEPIPLNIKIIIIGNPVYYNLLYALDEDFKKLFKVRADFDVVMEKNEENIKKFASFVCTVCEKEGLNHMEASAVARMIEFATRLAEDKSKISTQFSDIADVVREANFYAGQEKLKYITASNVQKAVEEKVYRSNLIAEKIKDLMADGTILIDSQGSKVGQINGLSVYSAGDYAFGRPTRLTVSVGLGREGIIDIERETKLGGPIHTKGVLILGGYLAGKYSKNKPFSLSARVVFEQSYGGVEGDSASSAEVYAILSALSGLPIRQDLAVTGSVNQVGEVQAIGGVNEKVEGFYEICKVKSLNGSQGVVIPESNVKNLVLKDEVVQAVKDKKFKIFAVKNIDEGIELLTGVKAGKVLDDGSFEKESVNFLVDQKITEMGKKLKELSIPEKEKKVEKD